MQLTQHFSMLQALGQGGRWPENAGGRRAGYQTKLVARLLTIPTERARACNRLGLIRVHVHGVNRQCH